MHADATARVEAASSVSVMEPIRVLKAMEMPTFYWIAVFARMYIPVP